MKKIPLLIFILFTALAAINAQNLEIKKRSKVKTFKLGDQIRLILHDSECSNCGSGFYEGELMKVSTDSVTLSLKEEHFFLDEKENRQRTAYYFKDGSKLVTVPKAEILKIKSQRYKNKSRKGLIAGYAMATVTIATFFNSAIISQNESVKKLRQIGVIESVVSGVLISGSVALQGRIYRIDTDEKFWKIQ